MQQTSKYGKRRILHVIPTLGRGGAERLVLDMCKAQVALGHKAAIACLSDINKYKSYSTDIEIYYPVIGNCFSFINNKLNTSEFDDLVSEFSPQIIHSHLYYADFISKYHIRPEITYISHIHGRIPEYETRLSKIRNRATLTQWLEHKIICRKYRRSKNNFITISPYYLNYLKNHLPEFQSRFFLLPNAINHSNFTFSPRQAVNSPLRLISIGRLEKIKGHELLIEVASILKAQGIEFDLKIYGLGSEENNLHNLILNSGLKNQVRLMGMSENINTELINADIYLHSAHEEPFGLALLEAMATGLPVISTDGGGNKELIRNNYNGFLISRDASKMAEIIVQIKNDPNDYTQLSQNAFKFSQNFDIREYVVRLDAIYEQFIDPQIISGNN